MFKFEPQDTQIWHFLSQIKGFFFFFAPNFAIREIERADFKYDNNFSK